MEKEDTINLDNEATVIVDIKSRTVIFDYADYEEIRKTMDQKDIDNFLFLLTEEIVHYPAGSENLRYCEKLKSTVALQRINPVRCLSCDLCYFNDGKCNPLDKPEWMKREERAQNENSGGINYEL